MTGFRHTDPRFPFLWAGASQPAGRRNRKGELTHYFRRYTRRRLGGVPAS